MYYQLINFGNEEFHAYPNKSLYWKRLNTLIVSDLHIGKSISYAKNKQFLPPYDTKEILNKIFLAIFYFFSYFFCSQYLLFSSYSMITDGVLIVIDI